MANITNTLIDNSENLKLVDVIKSILLDTEINKIDIATGYWDIPGTALLADAFNSFLMRENTKLRLLIGKDPYLFAEYNAKPEYKDEKYPEDFIKTDLSQIEVKDEYKKAVALLDNYLEDSDKIEIHIYREDENSDAQFLHSKCYIFLNTNDEVSYGIVGSSNFTQKGLEGNAELNYLETSWNCVAANGSPKHKTHEQWFEEKWALSYDWTKTFLEQILRPSKICQQVKTDNQRNPINRAGEQNEENSAQLTPYENYIKLLQDKFGMITDAQFKEILISYLPKEIRPLEYQLNAVQQCYSYMLAHGGFVLGDVVGLGKTIVGILLVKYYIENSSTLGRTDKVLIIVPPAIRSSWERTISLFDRNQADRIANHVKFITTGSLNRLIEEDVSEDVIDDVPDSLDSEEELVEDESDISNLDGETDTYGLVIIDESHKFRNSNTRMYRSLNDYLNNVKIRKGYYPFIGLLSATMQNNSPRDIQNQIYLFEHEPKKSSFEKVEGRDLDAFFRRINSEYNELIQQDGADIEQQDVVNRKNRLIALSQEVREKVLSDILVRRTRTDIKKHYQSDLDFPKVHEPENLEYEMDEELAELFYDTMNMIAPEKDSTDGFGYYRYGATMYLDDKYRDVYSGRNMSAERSSRQLAKIMQILLVKRLESSFEAFKESLRNFKRYTQNMVTMWEHDSIFICPQIDVNKELNIDEKKKNTPGRDITIETCFDDIREKIKRLNNEGRNEKGQNAEYKREDFKDKAYIDFVKKDLDKIDALLMRWEKNDYDPKREIFRSALRGEVKDSISGKIYAPYIFSSERNKPHKLVIFSEAISTVESLRRDIKNILGKEPLVITAANRTEKEQVIIENFDANYDKSKQQDVYDVIITTEVLAEGINLHRANSILNYDTPWNATRLIQRIGRVNRIGSENKDIYIYNFYPSVQGDAQINLVRNAYTKLQSFHTMFGEDSKIFSQDEELAEGYFESFVDGEESPQEKYISELRDFKNKNEKRYNDILNLERGEEQSINPISQDNLGWTYFAIKIRNKYGCIYAKVSNELGAEVISYEEMFKNCRCQEDANQEAFPAGANRSEKESVAIGAYNAFLNRQYRANNRNPEVTEAIGRTTRWINGRRLNTQAMMLIGIALKQVRNGNIFLARQLNNLMNEFDNRFAMLIPPTDEDVIQMVRHELGNIEQDNNRNYGEPYIYAGFYY